MKIDVGPALLRQSRCIRNVDSPIPSLQTPHLTTAGGKSQKDPRYQQLLGKALKPIQITLHCFFTDNSLNNCRGLRPNFSRSFFPLFWFHYLYWALQMPKSTFENFLDPVLPPLFGFTHGIFLLTLLLEIFQRKKDQI